MKRTLFISILIIFIISIVGCDSKQTPTKEKSSISQKELYDLQEKCGKICKEIYNKDYNGGERWSRGVLVNVYLYENHYNKKLNKCFMTINDEGSVGSVKTLMDVNENKLYGNMRVNQEGKIMSCRVFNKTCTLTEDWDTLIKPYMTE